MRLTVEENCTLLGGVFRESEDVVVLVISDAVIQYHRVNDRSAGEFAGLGDQLDELLSSFGRLTVLAHDSVDVPQDVRRCEESVAIVESKRHGVRRGGGKGISSCVGKSILPSPRPMTSR